MLPIYSNFFFLVVFLESFVVVSRLGRPARFQFLCLLLIKLNNFRTLRFFLSWVLFLTFTSDPFISPQNITVWVPPYKFSCQDWIAKHCWYSKSEFCFFVGRSTLINVGFSSFYIYCYNSAFSLRYADPVLLSDNIEHTFCLLEFENLQ